jgi:hypothetical protein
VTRQYNTKGTRWGREEGFLVGIETFKKGMGKLLYAATIYELRKVVSIPLLRGLVWDFRRSKAACYWSIKAPEAGWGLQKMTPP